MGPRAGSEPGGWRAATQTGPSPHSRPIRSPPPPGHCSGSQASGSFRGPRPTCSLHGPRPSVKAPPLQGCRRNLPGESKQPGNTRAGEQAVRRTARALLSPGDQAPLAGGRTARLRLWGAEWRPRLVPRPYRQGQLEYVTSHAQGGPGTLGWDWDRGSSARFLARALHTLPSYLPPWTLTKDRGVSNAACDLHRLQGTKSLQSPAGQTGLGEARGLPSTLRASEAS